MSERRQTHRWAFVFVLSLGACAPFGRGRQVQPLKASSHVSPSLAAEGDDALEMRPLIFRKRAKGVRFRGWRLVGSTSYGDRGRERTDTKLRGGLFNPMPGGYVAGYAEDTGLDIGGFRLPVYAVADGTLDYSEPGHTRWPGDDDKAVRLELDEPIPFEGRLVTHVWYAHLYELTYLQRERTERRIRVRGGERLGTSGAANGSPHLHLGFLLDDWVGQRWGTFLDEDEIRVLLGNYRKKERLPLNPGQR